MGGFSFSYLFYPEHLRGYLRKWIVPRLSEHPVRTLKAGEVEAWLRTLPLTDRDAIDQGERLRVLGEDWRKHASAGHTDLERGPETGFAEVSCDVLEADFWLAWLSWFNFRIARHLGAVIWRKEAYRFSIIQALLTVVTSP